MARRMPSGRAALVLLGLVALLAGLLLWQRERFFAWYAVRELAAADGASREACVKRVVEAGPACVPGLIDRLTSGSSQSLGNVEAGLIGLAGNLEDAAAQDLLHRLTEGFQTVSKEGRAGCLRILTACLDKLPQNAALADAQVRELTDVLDAARADSAVRYPFLRLTGALLEHAGNGQGLAFCSKLAVDSLAAGEAPTRLAAVQVLLGKAFRKNVDLLGQLVPLLKDSDAKVRKAALAALAPYRELAGDDDLLPLLHDADAEVQNLSELALRSRGLSDRHILLARLISDERPSARLSVLDRLYQVGDLEPGVWLQRLSEDTSPAVRAAAVRAAGQLSQADLSQRLRDMAGSDPSPTVRQLAGFYLNRRVQAAAQD